MEERIFNQEADLNELSFEQKPAAAKLKAIYRTG